MLFILSMCSGGQLFIFAEKSRAWLTMYCSMVLLVMFAVGLFVLGDVAPAGSNRSRHQGHEVAESLRCRGPRGDLVSVQAVTHVKAEYTTFQCVHVIRADLQLLPLG